MHICILIIGAGSVPSNSANKDEFSDQKSTKSSKFYSLRCESNAYFG